MTGQNWFDSLALSSLFLPYWKAGKNLLKQSVSLSLGLVGILVLKTMKGAAAMNKPTLTDYVIAYPLATPFWAVGFVYLFMNLSPQGFLGSLVVVLFFLFWLKAWIQSLTVILEQQSAGPVAQQGKEALTGSSPVKPAVNY